MRARAGQVAQGHTARYDGRSIVEVPVKVVHSLRSLKKRHKDCQIVRRKGKVRVICKADPKHKQVQG